ncbi:hypothetical protein [Roseococcus thiosulfatophilus]|uniref:hypothetical protein n=1 Tax=Roseococcus thiosulfatophilus TaxID=35813 RepID=UPI001A8D413D|nr:hypothetical protein [Roseococcus thiosulfatophilus]
MPRPSYPDTPRLDVAQEHFGIAVPDPFRWLASGGRHFFTRNSGLDNQPALVMRDGAAEQVVLAGHGAGEPVRQVIEDVTDLWAFAAHWTGLRP